MTRPREQSARLAALLEAAGARPLVYPAIEIAEPGDPAAASAALARLTQFDLAVFISPTAVRKAFARISAWPAALAAAAVGRGTARELEQHGVHPALVPESGADSEALLALPGLAQMAGKRVLVLRGEGGRELLGQTLEARGARVEYAELYRRVPPAADPAPLLQAWARDEVHAVTITSASGLRNLVERLGPQGADALRRTPLFAAHRRIADEARRLGVREVLVAGPGDDEMLERLVAYFTSHG